MKSMNLSSALGICLVTVAFFVLTPAQATIVKRPEPEENPSKVKRPESLDINDRLTEQDPLDRIQTNSRCKIFPLTMIAKRSYTIDLVSTDFDAYLRLEDAEGNPLAKDDDSGGNLNARIVFVAPRTGTYKIIATTFRGNALGAFSLKARATSVLFATQGKLANTDPLDKVRRTSHHKVHTLKMEPGKTYTIDLHSTEFDAYLRLEDSKSGHLAEDDDSGGGLDARIVFTPTRADTYRIIVTTFARNVTGNYSLAVTAKKQ